MSMLAERKQKQKWTLNPRGKYWSDDPNKFGQKMLEKMGWSAGKGLGANEDGITEHIRQSYKNDAKGVGFEDKGDQWTKHEVDFSSLLQNLGDNDDVSVDKPKVSLEEKSQMSRSRVHYHKFLRGKDLSRCSEKDLANVFGRKTLEKKQLQDTKSEVKDTTESRNFGVMTIHGGNMTEYFKTKLKNVIGKNKEYESDEERPSFGFGFNPAVKSSDETQTDGSERKKKKNKTKVVINECFDNPGFTDFNDDVQVENSNDKKNGKYLNKDNMVFDNPALDISDNMDSTNQKKKSKKRKLVTIVEESTQEIVKDFDGASHDNSEPRTKKQKKQCKLDDLEPEQIAEKAKKSSDKNSSLTKINKKDKKSAACNFDSVENIHIDESNEEFLTKKNKKAKKLTAVEVTTSETSENQLETENNVPKSKKGKKFIGIDNYGCTENIEKPEDHSLNRLTPTKKTKKEKKTGFDNFGCTESTVNFNKEAIELIEHTPKGVDNLGFIKTSLNEIGTKKIKKKKLLETKTDNSSQNIDSSTTNLQDTCNALVKKSKKILKKTIDLKSSEDTNNVDDTLENDNTRKTPVTKKSKKNKEIITGVDNLGCTEASDDYVCEKCTRTENVDNIGCTETSDDYICNKCARTENGVDNLACTVNTAQHNIEETIASVSDAIDQYQLELENEINEKKAKTQTKTSQKTTNKIVRRDFRNNFKTQTPKSNRWGTGNKFGSKFKQDSRWNPKKSIKNSIKGEIRYDFKGANLSKITGYGVR